MRIVPTNKLLVVVAMVVLPLSILVAFMPDKSTLAVLLTGLLVMVALDGSECVNRCLARG